MRKALPPVAQLLLLGVALWALGIGGEMTFGTWGSFEVRPALTLGALALGLHALASVLQAGRQALRAAAWGCAGVMCWQTEVLLRPEVLAPLALLAALDLALHRGEAPAPRASGRARAFAGVAALAALVVVGLLARYAIPEAVVSLGLAAVVAAAVAVAAALHTPLRRPERLLPLLGAYYLFFAFVAAPVIPFGPAIAWWLLCLLLLAGAAVAARGAASDVPKGLRRHRHEVHALPDAATASLAARIEAFLATGEGAEELSQRLERAAGEEPTGGALSTLAARHAEGRAPDRAHREHALRSMLELSP